MGFWSSDCENLTKRLWNPVDLYINQDERQHFRCNHPKISFKYYENGEKPQYKLKFKEIPKPDNKKRKMKLEKTLMKKEMTRVCKELSKKDDDLTEKIYEKHCKQVEKMEEKVHNLDGFIRSRRVQFFPTVHQQQIIKQWFYDTICVYNSLISHFTQIYTECDTLASLQKDKNNTKQYLLGKLLKENEKFPLNFRKLRELKISEYTKDHPKTPFCIIADTIKEFVSNAKGNATKLIKNQITEFKFTHKKHNRTHHSITLETHYTTENGFYPSIIGSIKIKDPNFEWSKVQHDYKLIYEKHTNKYYIHVPKYIFQSEEVSKRNPIAIMDPGERTAQTLYGLDHVIAIGENLRSIIQPRLKKIDKLKSKMDQGGKWKYNKKLKKNTKKKKRKYKRAIDRHHRKLAHIQQEFHYKTAIYLCENYDRIMVTDFSSKKVNSKDGDLEAMTKRVLGKISHYRFRQRLQHKCQEYGCQYLEVGEAFTSKTCSRCGYIHYLLGANKIYNCPKCGYIIDRDINGAINIFLKNHELVLY